MKGRDLRTGQHVILIRKKEKGRHGRQATVLTVGAVCYPFVIFQYESVQPMMVVGSNGPEAITRSSLETMTVNVQGCRFKQVTEQFAVLARRQVEPKLPSWLHDPDSDSSPNLD